MMVLAALCVAPGTYCLSQTFEVSGRVEVVRHGGDSARRAASEVVVWLTPLDARPNMPLIENKASYVLTQKDKQFTPHVLVVPVGSNVQFPNLDPFFHNVFSLFNGKRFDLGLYEGHSRRTVRFDREGVSFIFCNIHPDMGAVVVALKTPYYAVSSSNGLLSFHRVPPGRYRLNVWAENATIERLNTLSRTLEVSAEATTLGTMRVETSGDAMRHHTNKFGEDYKAVPRAIY